MRRLTVTATPAAATELAGQRIAAVIGAGRAHIALAGGNTPRATYEWLADTVEDWSDVELWLDDERIVSPDSPDSNYRLVKETLLDRASAPPPVLHAVPTDLGADAAAEAYGDLMQARSASSMSLVLLGFGPDAHTASLFPNAPTLAEQSRLYVGVHGSPKPPPERATMTIPAIGAADRVVALVVGADKATAVAKALGPPDKSAPASLIARERLELIVDEAAASAIPAERRA